MLRACAQAEDPGYSACCNMASPRRGSQHGLTPHLSRAAEVQVLCPQGRKQPRPTEKSANLRVHECVTIRGCDERSAGPRTTMGSFMERKISYHPSGETGGCRPLSDEAAASHSQVVELQLTRDPARPAKQIGSQMLTAVRHRNCYIHTSRRIIRRGEKKPDSHTKF